MYLTALPPYQSNTPARILSVAFFEACERLIAVRALLDDPRLETRRQGSAMVAVLHDGLRSVERQLQQVRPAIFDVETARQAPATALAGIGIALAGLRQVHAHLGYLGTRWPLGTADLFARKLVAEEVPIPVPTLCPTDHYEDEPWGVSYTLQQRLRQAGLQPQGVRDQALILTLPTMDLLDPLSWAVLLYGIAMAMVDAWSANGQLILPAGPSESMAKRRRNVAAALAARLVGEPTYAACAMRTLLSRISGLPGIRDLSTLLRCSEPYSLPLDPGAPETLSSYLGQLLQAQASLGGWGRIGEARDSGGPVEDHLDVPDLVYTSVPEPLLPGPEAIETLYNALCDGRPINAHPPDLPLDFQEQLDGGVDAQRFYAVLQHAEERPCSLATILTVGWQYKLRRSYALCYELMSTGPWEGALERLSAHVLERCALLQQSIEASHVQRVFSRWRDR